MPSDEVHHAEVPGRLASAVTAGCCPRRRGERVVWFVLAVCLLDLRWGCVVTMAQTALGEGAAPTAPYEPTKFLIGLRQQGLFYLQAEYMKTYPPKGQAEEAWYQREKILAAALQAGAIEDRLPQLAAADAEAAKAIAAEGDSPRRVLWRADRAQTWYYLASRPLFEQVLFYGPTPALRRGLKESADRGDQAYEEAITAVAAYLDHLAGPQGDAFAVQARRLNLSAFALSRQLQFEHCWVMLHRAVAMSHGDVDQSLLAGQVIRSLQDQNLIQEPGEQVPARAEALLMAGIASRLQTDWPAAQAYLDAAGKAAAAVPPPAAQGLEWVVFAAAIERVRLQIDQGQFTQAIGSLNLMRREMDAEAQLDRTVKLARRLSLAMLEFEACSLAADASAAEKNRSAQVAYARQRFDALATLSAEAPDSRQAIYQMVADRLPDVAGVAGLPPFGKAVFAARWIRERKFDQVLAAADSLVSDPSAEPGFLKQEAIFFKAVCQEELKQPLPAAQSYLAFARDWPQDRRAGQALLSALSLMARQPDVLEDAASRAIVVELGDLLERAGSPQIARYKANWLPLVAEANLRESRYERAAELFQMIPKDSRQYGLAMVGRILAVSGKIRFGRASPDQQKAEAASVIDEAVQAARQLATGKPADTQPQSPDVLAARLLLEAAKLSIDVLGDADRALTLLEGAETRWRNNPSLLAQLLNVRIRALQKSGKLDQAAPLVDRFMAARPEAAGLLLAGLLSDMQREIEQQQKTGRTDEAGRYAMLAVDLAEQLNKWAAAHPDAIKPQQQYAIRYRLARALLGAGQAERALGVFEELYKEDAARGGGQAADAGVLEGRAACLFHLGKWNDARQAYMDIWRRAAPRSEIWWQSILRSLQCSVQLKDEDPNKILKVIRQHKDLYPDMGGAALARQFDELSFEVLKRITATQASQPAGR
jgi:hypothetical protein